MDDDDLPRRTDGTPKGPLALALAGALIGALFAALSTSDFMQHLDRQVHAIHCSFLPGAAKEIAESGCRTVMMSPYSSFFRESLWGGVPISLWALAVFAFLVYRTAPHAVARATPSGETKVLVAAAGLPVADVRRLRRPSPSTSSTPSARSASASTSRARFASSAPSSRTALARA